MLGLYGEGSGSLTHIRDLRCSNTGKIPGVQLGVYERRTGEGNRNNMGQTRREPISSCRDFFGVLSTLPEASLAPPANLCLD